MTLTSGSITGTGGTLTGTSYALQGGVVTANLGTGNVTVTTGTTTLNGTSASTSVAINSGTLTLGSADRLADGATVTVAGGILDTGTTLTDTVSTFNMSSGSLNGTGTITATTYGLSGGTVTGNLGTGTLNSSGNVALNGTAGATAVNVTAGTLTLGSADRLANGATVTVSGGTLAMGSYADTVSVFNMSSGSITGTGPLTATTYGLSGGTVTGNLGTGTLNSSGNVALHGTAGATAVNVSAGTLTLGSASRFTSSPNISLSGGQLTLAGAESVATYQQTGGTLAGTGFTLTSAAAYDMQAGTVSAILGGSVGLNKTTSGTVILSGANTFTGGISITGGTLQLGAVAVIPNGTGKGNVDISALGTLDMNTFSETIGGLSGAGTVDNVAAAVGATTLTVGDNNQSTTFSGVIKNTGGVLRLAKGGSGTLTLSGDNKYDDTTSVTAGVLNIQHANALGSILQGTTVASGATLQLQGGVNFAEEALTLSGQGVSNSGVLRSISGNNIWNGDITVGTAAVTRVAADAVADTLTLAGTITLSTTASDQFVLQGAGNIDVTGKITGASKLTSSSTGAGIRTLSNASNDYAGDTSVNGGFLQAGVANALPYGAGKGNLVLNGGSSAVGVFNLNGYDVATNGLAGTSNTFVGLVVNNANGTTKTLTVGNGDATASYAGVLADNNIESGTGILALTKTGNGTQTLSGTTANTFTGLTTVSAGTLELGKTAGVNAVGGDVTVSGGTLKWLANDQMSDATTTDLVLNSGTVDLNGKTETLGTFTNNGGDFSTGDGGKLYGTGSTVTWAAGTNTINNNGLVSDHHWVISGGTNLVKEGPQGGTLQVSTTTGSPPDSTSAAPAHRASAWKRHRTTEPNRRPHPLEQQCHGGRHPHRHGQHHQHQRHQLRIHRPTIWHPHLHREQRQRGHRHEDFRGDHQRRAHQGGCGHAGPLRRE